MRWPVVCVLGSCLLLCGCSNTVRGAAADLPMAAAYHPLGRLVDRGSKFVPEGGGYALVLLRKGDPSRNERACAKMMEAMVIRVGPADSRPTIMDQISVYERPVYWPVTAISRINCEGMLRNYDYARADVHYQLIPNWQRLGQGPFVVVRKENGNQAGLFDFSNVAGDDFDEQFAAVVNYMSQRTDVWSADFYRPATFRQTMRYYILERSGEGPQVLASLITMKDG